MATEGEGTTQQGEQDTQGSAEQPLTLQDIANRVREKAAEEKAAAADEEAAKAKGEGGEDEDDAGDDDEGEAAASADKRAETLGAELADIKGKLAQAMKDADAKLDAFKAALKKNPAKAIRDLGVTWQALADDFERLETPGVAAASETEAKLLAKVDELQKRLDAAEQRTNDAHQAERDKAARSTVGDILAKGGDAWPVCMRKENADEAIDRALKLTIKRSVKIMEKRAAKGDKRPISDELAAKLVRKSFDKIEQNMRADGKRKAPPEEQPQRRSLSGTAPTIGATRDGSDGKPAKDLATKKREIVDKVRRNATPST